MSKYKDKCIICDKTFENRGESPENVFVCSKACSIQFKVHPDVAKKLYKERFSERGKSE